MQIEKSNFFTNFLKSVVQISSLFEAKYLGNVKTVGVLKKKILFTLLFGWDFAFFLQVV